MIKTMVLVEIGFTNTKKMGMMISNKFFNVIYFVLKISIASIPMSQLHPSVGSVSIGVPSIKVGIRQPCAHKRMSRNYPTSVKVSSLNTMYRSSRDTRDIKAAEVKYRAEFC